MVYLHLPKRQKAQKRLVDYHEEIVVILVVAVLRGVWRGQQVDVGGEGQQGEGHTGHQHDEGHLPVLSAESLVCLGGDPETLKVEAVSGFLFSFIFVSIIYSTFLIFPSWSLIALHM